MNRPQILLIEDSPIIAELIEPAFRFVFSLKWAKTIAMAQGYLKYENFDGIIAEVKLPDGDGISFCSSFQEKNSNGTPFFLVSHEDRLQDKIRAFSAGADDYITIPFDPIELRARMESSVAKSAKRSDDGDLLFWKNIKIDRRRQEVFILREEGGDTYETINLTSLEFRLLTYLATRAGDVVNRDRILDDIWGENIHIYPRSVDTHVSNIRKKLGKASGSIQSVRGTGYKFCPAS